MKTLYKIVVIMAICFVLSGCFGPSQDGKPFMASEICIKGVTYYSGPHQLAPAFTPDGGLYTCVVGEEK